MPGGSYKWAGNGPAPSSTPNKTRNPPLGGKCWEPIWLLMFLGYPANHQTSLATSHAGYRSCRKLNKMRATPPNLIIRGGRAGNRSFFHSRAQLYCIRMTTRYTEAHARTIILRPRPMPIRPQSC